MLQVANTIFFFRFPFWQYNIPATLADYLEGAYYCRCGSLVFSDTIGHVMICPLPTDNVADGYDDDVVPIAIRCCSYRCYEYYIEPNIVQII